MNYALESCFRTQNSEQLNTFIRDKIGIYAHMETDSSRKTNKTVCKHYIRDQCKKGDDCEFIHEYAIDKLDLCKFGDNCTNHYCIYNHKSSKRADVCCSFARGVCLNKTCDSRHIVYTLCPRYLAGFCPDGPNCTMQHPQLSGPITIYTRQVMKKPGYIGHCGHCCKYHGDAHEITDSDKKDRHNAHHGQTSIDDNIDFTGMLLQCPTAKDGSRLARDHALINKVFEHTPENFHRLYDILREIEASERADRARARANKEIEDEDA